VTRRRPDRGTARSSEASPAGLEECRSLAAAQTFAAHAEVTVRRVTLQHPPEPTSHERPRVRAQSAAHGRQLCSTLRRLREQELRDALLSSWRQSMTAPDWCAHAMHALHRDPRRCDGVACIRDADDHEWRPTFMPHMKLSALGASDFNKPSLRFLASFATQIAFLDQPKRALRLLRNERRMHAYQLAVQRMAAGAPRRLSYAA